MKVLHLISSSGMYGAEAVILNLSHTLNAGSHQSSLGVFQNSPDAAPELHEAARQQGLGSHLIACRGQIDTRVPARIRELADRTGAQLVHAHGYKADVYGWLALRKSGLPLVSTCHTWYDNNLALSVYGAFDRRVLRHFDGVVAVSEEVRKRLLDSGVAERKIRIIQNGIDLRAFDAAQPSLPCSEVPGTLTVGLVGRLSSEKGIDLFLEAAAQAHRSFPAAQFFVVGDGPDRAQLQALIDRAGLDPYVSLLGRRDDMPGVYASLDVLVSSSRQEGLPIALLEGMASRLPVVATAVGAVPTVIRDGLTGVLVQPGDAPVLAAAIADMLADASKRERLGSAARQLIADEFSADRMAEDYLRLYSDVLRN